MHFKLNDFVSIIIIIIPSDFAIVQQNISLNWKMRLSFIGSGYLPITQRQQQQITSQLSSVHKRNKTKIHFDTFINIVTIGIVCILPAKYKLNERMTKIAKRNRIKVFRFLLISPSSIAGRMLAIGGTRTCNYFCIHPNYKYILQPSKKEKIKRMENVIQEKKKTFYIYCSFVAYFKRIVATTKRHPGELAQYGTDVCCATVEAYGKNKSVFCKYIANRMCFRQYIPNVLQANNCNKQVVRTLYRFAHCINMKLNICMPHPVIEMRHRNSN